MTKVNETDSDSRAKAESAKEEQKQALSEAQRVEVRELLRLLELVNAKPIRESR